METVFSPYSVAADAANRARIALIISLILAVAPLLIFSQTQISTSEDDKTITVEDAPDMDVYAFGKSVIVKQRAKGVCAIGGDIIIEGSVSGDVATIGGSVTQRRNAYIGGDVIVFGGKYKPDSQEPLREPDKQTVMVGMFEDELRNVGQNPTELFSPSLSLSFLATRVVLVLFWFVVSLGLTTLAPGAVSRGIARFQLSTLRVCAVGTFALVLTLVGTLVGVKILPNYISVSIFLMALVFLMLAVVFGRVVLQLSVGKLIQKNLLPEGNKSETVTMLLGVIFWSLLLSIPYIWTLAVVALFVAGLGLVLTAKMPATWRQS